MRLHVFLLYTLLVFNVGLRLFTNKLRILPKALNIADVFITVLLVLIALSYSRERKGQSQAFSFGRRLFLFNVVLFAGAMLNLRFFHAPAAFSQVIMWNEPLLLFLAIMRLPFKENEVDGFRRILLGLIVIEFTLGVLQVPIYLKTGATEAIIGTFYGNAEQYQGFIMLGVYYLLGRQHVEPARRLKMWSWILGLLCLIVLIDNKASWLGVLVSIALVMHVQRRGGTLWFLRPRYFIPLIFLFGFGAAVAIRLSPSVRKLHYLADAYRSGNLRNLGKIKAYDDIFHAFGDNWHMAVVGSGPGNFYSRSGSQFYLLGASLAQKDVKSVRTFSSKISNSMGGVINLTTKPPFYAHFYLNREIYRIGSGQVDSPFSTYAGLLGETGVVGTLVYLGIYIGVLRHLLIYIKQGRFGGSHFYPFALATFGLFVYMMTDSVYNNWLETGRITTIAWSMLALLLKCQPAGLAVEPLVVHHPNRLTADAFGNIAGHPSRSYG